MHSLVIADTSCLIVLKKIERLALLQELYTEIFISPEIKNETSGIQNVRKIG